MNGTRDPDDANSVRRSFNARVLCRYGQMVINCNDLRVGRSLLVYGEWSEGEVDVFRRFLRPGALVVEAGANMGAHTLALADLVGAHGMVLAYEPQRLLFHALCANAALNSLSQILVRHAAMGRAPGTLQVPVPDPCTMADFSGLALGELQHGERVPVETIDALRVEQCDLIKVDVGGMEADVLRGAMQTIRRLRPPLYVANDRIQGSEDLIALIRDLGYRLWWSLVPLFNPRNWRRVRENVFDGAVSVNMLCLPAEEPWDVDLPEVKGPQDHWHRLSSAARDERR